MAAHMEKMRLFVQSLNLVFCALCLAQQFAIGDGIDDETSSLVVEHTFDAGHDAVFSRRGTIDLQSLHPGKADYINEFLLTDLQKDKLKELAESNGVYRVRVGQRTSITDDHKSASSLTYVYSFIKACVLYESRLSHTLRVNIDQAGNLVAVTMTSSTPYCRGGRPSHRQLEEFDTSVEVQRNVDGPVPDSIAYIQKLEHEKKKQVEGQQGENKSFFARYWMYIVPLVVMVMFMSNADSSGGGAARG